MLQGQIYSAANEIANRISGVQREGAQDLYPPTGLTRGDPREPIPWIDAVSRRC